MVVDAGMNGSGQREVLSTDVGTSEEGVIWTAFLRSPMAAALVE